MAVTTRKGVTIEYLEEILNLHRKYLIHGNFEGRKLEEIKGFMYKVIDVKKYIEEN